MYNALIKSLVSVLKIDIKFKFDFAMAFKKKITSSPSFTLFKILFKWHSSRFSQHNVLPPVYRCLTLSPQVRVGHPRPWAVGCAGQSPFHRIRFISGCQWQFCKSCHIQLDEMAPPPGNRALWAKSGHSQVTAVWWSAKHGLGFDKVQKAIHRF